MRRVQAAVAGLALVVLLTACPGTVSVTAPSNVTATPELSAIDLNWQDDSDNEQGFVIFRAAGEGDFVQLAEVGPNVTSYRDTALEADVVYRYAVAAKGATQNSAQTVQAEAGVSVSYHGEAVRSFTGEVVDYVAGQADLVALDPFSESGPTPLGSGTISAQGGFTFTYNSKVTNLFPLSLCVPTDADVVATFSIFLFVGGLSEMRGALVLASSQATAERSFFQEVGEVGDTAVLWEYVAEDATYKFSREACGTPFEYNLELKAGWNTVVSELIRNDPTFGGVIGRTATAVPPANLNWYFVNITQGPQPPVNSSPANFFGFSGN